MSYARAGLALVARDALTCTLAVLLAGVAAAVAAPAPSARCPRTGCARGAVALRSCAQGLRGHGAQHHVARLVHGRRRSAVGRL